MLPREFVTCPLAMTCSRPYSVEIENLSKRFGDFTALDRVSLTLAPGEFFALLGPSGCGKTTLLRIVAGLEMPDEGSVRICGQDTAEVPAHRRPVNTVFQSYALFPHLTVWDNVAFGLRMKRVPSGQISERVQKSLELVDISPLAQRKPHQLSGGQKQRVALARALINEPQVLLLDEPLGALDLKLRKQLQLELLQLQKRLHITFLYVTHDQEEALILSDRIAVMRQGQIEQIGTREELYERPRTRFASQFLGSCSLLPATLAPGDANGTWAATALGVLRLAGSAPGKAQFTLAIRPEKVQLRQGPISSLENHVPVRVAQRLYVGSETHYQVSTGDQTLAVEIMNHESGSPGFHVGDPAVAYLPPEALIVLDD